MLIILLKLFTFLIDDQNSQFNSYNITQDRNIITFEGIVSVITKYFSVLQQHKTMFENQIYFGTLNQITHPSKKNCDF